MRRRLLIVYVSLTALVLLVLAVPLARSFAMDEFHHRLLRQLGDTLSLTSLVEPFVTARDLPASQRTLAEYEQRTGETAAIYDIGGTQLASGPTALNLIHGRDKRRLASALAGNRPMSLDYPYNLRAERLVVVVPIVRGTTVVGAVATAASTKQLRDRVLARWAALMTAAVAALTIAAMMAVPVTRWFLRPLERLDLAARAFAGGLHTARVPSDEGPPEVRTLARVFNGMAERLERVLTTQRAFIADASHQLRSPLTSLRLRVEHLGTALGEDHPAAPTAAAAALEADRLSAILDQLLDLARPEEFQATPETVDVASVLTNRRLAWQVAAERRSVELCVQAEPLVLRADQGLLEQMIDNLVDNALRFAPEGSQIRLEASRQGGVVTIAVQDEGPGMSPAELARAKDRFWRSPTASQGGGSGLGLSIVDRLAQTADGYLTLDVIAPHGLRAEIALPLLPGPTASDNPGESRAKSLSGGHAMVTSQTKTGNREMPD